MKKGHAGIAAPHGLDYQLVSLTMISRECRPLSGCWSYY